MISFLDEQVGMIMKQLKKIGLEQNTLVLFSSDNGTSFSPGVDYSFFNSVGGFRGLKMELYEGGIRVPFIARWPGKIAKNSSSNLLSIQYDMMATLAELTGIKSISTDGISFLPTLLGQTEKQQQHHFLYFEYPENGGQIAVRLGDWKGIRKNIKKDLFSPWELYNLKTDPFEKQNLATQNPAILAEMDKIVAREHQHAPITDWEFLHPKTK